MFLNCGVREDSWESLGLQGDPTSPFWRRSVLGVHWKDWCWSWNSNTLTTWCEELTHLKRPWILGKIEGRRRRGRQRLRCLDSIIHSIDMNLSQLQEIVKDREAYRRAVHVIAKTLTVLSNWTTNCWLTMLWQFQVNSEGTQPYIYKYLFSPEPPAIQAGT